MNTAFGIATMLLMMLKIEKPDQVLFCFDADEDTFRHEEYEEYKEGRAETPDDFYSQVPRALQVLDAFAIPSVSGSKFEADDYACTYAKEAAKQGSRVTMVTGDRDLLQIVDGSIRVAIPHKGYQAAEYMTPDTVTTKYGVTPAQIASYKGLVGDSSDNLPGVHGIGPKAASALLQKFGTLANIYANIDQVKPSWKEKLIADKDKALFSERMATLRCDAPLHVPFSGLGVSIDRARVLSVFRELEFTLPRKRFEELSITEWGSTHIVGDAPQSAPQAPTPQVEQMSLL